MPSWFGCEIGCVSCSFIFLFFIFWVSLTFKLKFIRDSLDFGDEWWCYAGIVLCLFWNIIAVTTAWIKGEGEWKYTVHLFCTWSSIYFGSSSVVNLNILWFLCRGKNLVPCCYLLHSRGSWILCLVVPSTVPSFQVYIAHFF